MRPLPHVTWLRAFEACARHSSFAAAADELNLTPAAISQQIKLLEQSLEMKLFKRLPKGVELTDIGQAYAQPVRKSFQDMQLATNGLFQPKRKTALHIRASISFGVLVLAPRLHEFRAQHPEIDISLSTTVWADRMNDATIDIDIRYGAGDWPDDEIWPLGSGQATLVCNPSDAAIFQRDPETLLEADTVHIVGSENDWSLMFRELGIERKPPKPWMQMDSSLLALQTIASGRGVAIINNIFSKQYLARNTLVSPFTHTLMTQQNFFMAARPNTQKQDSIDVFRKWLTALTH